MNDPVNLHTHKSRAMRTQQRAARALMKEATVAAPRLELIIKGDEASAAAAELIAAFGAEATVVRRDVASTADVWKGKGLDPFDSTGLILTIPTAVLAEARDLADRIEKRSRAESLLATARNLTLTRNVDILLVTPAGRHMLSSLSSDRLLELVAQATPDRTF